MDLKIQHDKDAHKFFAMVDDKESVLQYRIINDKILDYYHTFVPPELRGRKIAEQIVKFALDYAKQNNYQVIPSCPYVQRFIDLNSKYKTLVNI